MNILHLPLLALAVSAASPSMVRAQCAACNDHDPRGRGEALTLGSNALIGGLAAGVRAHRAGRPFRGAFVRGAAGGTLVYAGKRVSAETFAGAGAVGRPLAALGSSVVHNAAEGRGALSRVMIPLGPLRVYVEPRRARLHARLEAASILAIAHAATRPGARFMGAQSLSSGAVVFARDRGARAGIAGQQAAGVLIVDHPENSEVDTLHLQRITAHERVHALQYDQGFLFWGVPAETWLAERFPAARRIRRYVDLGIHVPAQSALGALIPYSARPWEVEAYFLSRTAPVGER
jgi:hypothetical protein